MARSRSNKQLASTKKRSAETRRKPSLDKGRQEHSTKSERESRLINRTTKIQAKLNDPVEEESAKDSRERRQRQRRLKHQTKIVPNSTLTKVDEKKTPAEAPSPWNPYTHDRQPIYWSPFELPDGIVLQQIQQTLTQWVTLPSGKQVQLGLSSAPKVSPPQESSDSETPSHMIPPLYSSLAFLGTSLTTGSKEKTTATTDYQQQREEDLEFFTSVVGSKEEISSLFDDIVDDRDTPGSVERPIDWKAQVIRFLQLKLMTSEEISDFSQNLLQLLRPHGCLRIETGARFNVQQSYGHFSKREFQSHYLRFVWSSTAASPWVGFADKMVAKFSDRYGTVHPQDVQHEYSALSS